MVDVEPDEPRYTRFEEPRLRAPAVTQAYLPEPGYPATYLPISATQPPPPGVDARIDPRYAPGNTTPPSGRTPGYQTQGYPPTTRTTIPTIPPSNSYADPRLAQARDPRDLRDPRDTGYGAYADPRARHR